MLPPSDPLIVLSLLLFFHYLADYPWQGDFLSKAKNALNPISGVPWWHAMTAHCFIQAGFVGLVTGQIWLAVAEFIIHFTVDHAKCLNKISFNTDQAIHIGCKFIWTGLLVL